MTQDAHPIQRIIGLDTHPDSFTAAIVSGVDARTATCTLVSDALALAQLLPWCEQHVARADDLLVFEASANTFALAERLTRAGYTVMVLNSQEVARISTNHHLTDRICAERVARAYLGGSMHNVWIPDPDTRDRRQLLTAHEQAVTACTRATNQLKSLLNEHCIRWGSSSLTSPRARQRLLRLHPWNTTQKLLIENAHDALLEADRRRHQLRQHMAAELLAQPGYLQLLRIYGISLVTAYALLAMIGDIRRFATPKKLVAYFGLRPHYKQSGKGERRGGIVKQGRKSVRAKLVQGAHSVFRHRSGANRLHRWAWALAYRKPRNLAVIAVARKLVTAVWYLLQGKPFHAEEETPFLQRKLRVQAKELKIAALRDLGFTTYSHFIDHIIQQISQQKKEKTPTTT